MKQAAESVLAQQFQDFEYLVVDDASTDATPDILQQLAQQDPRIKVFRNEQNLGVAASRNRALRQARGVYLAFLDGDDLWYPEFLSEMVMFMQRGKLAFGCASHDRVDEALNPIRKPFIVPEAITRKELLQTCSVPLLTTLLHRASFEEIRFPLLPVNNDYALWLHLIRTCQTIHGNQKVLGVYRMRKGSVSSDKVRSMRYIWRIYREQEKLSFFAAGTLTIRYILNGLKKYYGR